MNTTGQYTWTGVSSLSHDVKPQTLKLSCCKPKP